MTAHPVTHLAQSEDEQFTREFFDEIGRGFFVELGVGPPPAGSQTLPLERSGWTGVLIEPQPDLAAFLVTARSAKVFAVACSAPDKAGESLALQVSRPPTAIERSAGGSDSETRYVVMVPVRTLDSLLEEAEAPIPIDFLAINVEGQDAGGDFQALRGFDISRWQPHLVALDREGGSLAAARYLRGAGYRLIRCGTAKDWYAPRELNIRLTWRQRWNNMANFYLGLPLRQLRRARRRVARQQ